VFRVLSLTSLSQDESPLGYSPDFPLSSTVKLTLNLPTTTIVAQLFNVIKWQLKFNPVA